MHRFRKWSLVFCVAFGVIGVGISGCDLRTTPAPITVYSSTQQVSFPLPQGWTADEAIMQAGFHMQTFTGRSVDVPERPGIRAQILAGPMPDGAVDDVAARFRRELEIESEETYWLHGHEGRFWSFLSEDEEEASKLMLTNVDGRLYGLYVTGEARTLEAYGDAIAHMYGEFSLEQEKYFDVYEAPGGDIVIKHPRSWPRTHALAKAGESLFVGFRSSPLAVEKDGMTVHTTLEVTVNRVAPEVTVESFYAERAELLGDTYRLLKHQVMEDVGAISTLYAVETQLASHLERTVYFVNDEKSFIYKFNTRNRVYHAIEPWVDEIVRGFFSSDSAMETDE
ncbi:MAG: hypothetical protein E2P02_20760 [Acidobacteria bacterium]|nr:MAG: hypothetical protein E2P02_20760 [Acidobacteriota bacterium]